MRGFAAWMQPNDDALGPRRYTHEAEQSLVLYDGVLLDRIGTWAAHDAAVLARHWSELPDRLEGRFVVVRIGGAPDELELLNDPYRVHQTFVHHVGARFWISNSARLLARLGGCCDIDMEGMAQNVGMYFAAGDRTLVEGIRAIPAAQHWTWSGEEMPRQTTYDDVSQWATRGKRRFGPSAAERLARAMGAMLENLAASFGRLQCPITAGRDSRVLVGLMIAGDIPGDFFTRGDPASVDARIAACVARRLALPHRNLG